jgi:hypothetical protein
MRAAAHGAVVVVAPWVPSGTALYLSLAGLRRLPHVGSDHFPVPIEPTCGGRVA